MALIDQTIRERVVGDDLDVLRTVEDIPSGLTLAKAYFTVKADLTDPDGSAVVQKTVTTASGADGQIEDAGADGTGTIRFILDNADTDAMGNRWLDYDVVVVYSNGKSETLEVGQVYLEVGVTDAQS